MEIQTIEEKAGAIRAAVTLVGCRELTDEEVGIIRNQVLDCICGVTNELCTNDILEPHWVPAGSVE